VLIPYASGSGNYTLAIWLAMQGFTFWGDDLIALTHNCDAIALSTLCAPVKSPSRSVIFETEEGKASRHTVLALQKDASAREGRWNSQFIMLDQIRAPLAKNLAKPNVYPLRQYVDIRIYQYVDKWIRGLTQNLFANFVKFVQNLLSNGCVLFVLVLRLDPNYS